jgi:hypothetical protein
MHPRHGMDHRQPRTLRGTAPSLPLTSYIIFD